MGNSKKEYWKNILVFKKLKAIEYKGGKCQECNYDKFYGALEFHHRDPIEKEFVWNALKKFSWKRILVELDKCDLLCSNCHREKHSTPGLVDRVLEWRDNINIVLFFEPYKKKCPECGVIFETKEKKKKHCSNKCYQKARETVEWPSNLVELVENSDRSAVARMLGVSQRAVSKRLRNHYGL